MSGAELSTWYLDNAIRAIITSGVGRQQDIAARLAELGLPRTQATVSRRLQAMGAYRYYCQQRRARVWKLQGVGP